MRRFVLHTVFVALLVPVATSAIQTPSQDELAIRDLIRREDSGLGPTLADDAIFASANTPQPLVGSAERERYNQGPRVSISAGRPNEALTTTVRRLVIAEAGDLAYEFSNFRREWDAPGGGRSGFNGSLLRVWRKINGQWFETAHFARPNEL